MTLAERLKEYIAACFTGHLDRIPRARRRPAGIGPALPRGKLAAGHLGHRPGAAQWPGNRRKPAAIPAAAIRSPAIRALNALASPDQHGATGSAQFPSVLEFGRDRPGPGPADRPRQAEPHVRRHPGAAGPDSDRTRKAVRRRRARVARPGATRRDRPQHCHRRGRTAGSGRARQPFWIRRPA